MKKIYILAIIAFGFAFTSSAQPEIEDGFEFYTLGDIGAQAPWWRTWSGTVNGPEDLDVVDDFANTGDQAGYVGGNGVQDVILDLGNKTSSDWTLTFYMRVSAGSTGYYNVQGTLPAGAVTGVFNSSNIYFNETGSTPGEGFDQTDGSVFTYPEDTFFLVQFYFDVDSSTYIMYVDGVQVNPVAVPFQTDSTLGGMDFFSINANNEYWIDDLEFEEGQHILGTNDFDVANFTVYPNPVKDVLNISTTATVDAITVYDVLGKVVLQSRPDAISPSINMSALSSGAYLVQVTIGNASKTVKVVK